MNLKIDKKEWILIDSTLNLSKGASRQVRDLVRHLVDIERRKVVLVKSAGVRINVTPRADLKIVELPNFTFLSLVNSLFLYPLWHLRFTFRTVYHPWGVGLSWGFHRHIVGVHHPNLLIDLRRFTSLRLIMQRVLVIISIYFCQLIRVPSHAVAHQIASMYPWTKPKLRVVSHAIDSSRWNAALALHNKGGESFGVEKASVPYIICWSAFYPITKNLETLLFGFARLREEDFVRLRLVLAGTFPSDAYREQTLALIKFLELSACVEVIENPSFKRLVNLIDNSAGIILPFRYETFGYSYLEARLFNKPIAVGLSPVAFEVTEGQVRYFDLDSEVEIADAMTNLLAASGRVYSYNMTDRYKNIEAEMSELSNLILTQGTIRRFS